MTIINTHPFPTEKAQERLIAMRNFLLGANYHRALISLEFNRRLFNGFRKDGVTPEFDHHICQMQFVRTLLPHLMKKEVTLATVGFHDTMEDKNLTEEDIVQVYTNRNVEVSKEDEKFAWEVARATRRVSKVYKGVKVASEEDLFEAMAECPVSSFMKAVDRVHNFQTMVGVFSHQKQLDYLAEGQKFFLPMLKKAERNFPEQEAAYKNVKTLLKTQMHLIQLVLENEKV